MAIDFNPDFTDFPQDAQVADSVAFVLENTCLAGDLILFFPDMVDRMMRGNRTWRPLMLWAAGFTSAAKSVVDDLSLKMLAVLRQELDVNSRSDDFVNPYREENHREPETPKMHFKKARKKPRKGPSLAGRLEL